MLPDKNLGRLSASLFLYCIMRSPFQFLLSILFLYTTTCTWSQQNQPSIRIGLATQSNVTWFSVDGEMGEPHDLLFTAGVSVEHDWFSGYLGPQISAGYNSFENPKLNGAYGSFRLFPLGGTDGWFKPFVYWTADWYRVRTEHIQARKVCWSSVDMAAGTINQTYYYVDEFRQRATDNTHYLTFITGLGFEVGPEHIKLTVQGGTGYTQFWGVHTSERLDREGSLGESKFQGGKLGGSCSLGLRYIF